jgi:hypothetical protein
MNAEWEDFTPSDRPNKKMISGYLMQKHIKRKKSRNNVPKLDKGDKTFFQTNLTFENLCRLDISPSLLEGKPLARENDSIMTRFLNKPEESALVKISNRTMSFPNKFDDGK